MSLPTKEEWEALGFIVHPDLCSKSTEHQMRERYTDFSQPETNEHSLDKHFTDTLNQERTMNELIDNLINGNLKDAKRQAKRFEEWQIRSGLIERGYSRSKASLTAEWLKGRDCWQAACDAK